MWKKTKKYEHLAKELDKTRKLLFACRMIHHEDTFEEVDLNIYSREAELTEHLIRLFQHSSDTLKGLLPALSKCLDARRTVKSNSMEAVIYTALGNLTKPDYKEKIDNPHILEETDAWLIGHSAIVEEVKKNVYGENITGQNNAFYWPDIGKVLHSEITRKCRDKFRAKKADFGTGKEKERALRFSKTDLKAKSIEYDVPDKIEVNPYNQVSLGLDSFDTILLEGDRVGTTGTHGTAGTHVDNADEVIHNRPHAQITSDIERKKNMIKPENIPTHNPDASQASQASQIEKQSLLESYGIKNPLNPNNKDKSPKQKEKANPEQEPKAKQKELQLKPSPNAYVFTNDDDDIPDGSIAVNQGENTSA